MKPSDFAEAMKDVYPSLNNGGPSMGLKLRSPKKAENVPSSSQARPTTADSDHAVATSGGITSEPRMSFDYFERESRLASIQDEPVAKTPVKPKMPDSVFARFTAPRSSVSSKIGGGEKGATPNSGRRLPWVASGMQSREHSDQWRSSQVVIGRRASPTPSKVQSEVARRPRKSTRDGSESIEASSKPGPHRNAPKNNFDSLSRPPTKTLLSNEDDSEKPESQKESSTARVSVFTEFASAWKRLGPGGAFAARESEPEPKPSSRRQLNVLSWDL